MDKEESYWSPPDSSRGNKTYLTFDEIEEQYGLFIAQLCKGYGDDYEPYPSEIYPVMRAIKKGLLDKVETREDWDQAVAATSKKMPDPKRVAAGKQAAKTRAKNRKPTGQAAKDAAAMKVDLGIKPDEPEIEMCNPNQFLKVPYGLLQCPGWRGLRGLECSLLLELIKRTITTKRQKDSYGLYEDFYKRGYLSCCVKQKELAQWFGVGQSSISRALMSLENKGYIQKHENPKFKNINVYVVGFMRNGHKHYAIMA